MSYLVQMLGLTHQNFLSTATRIVLAVALIRGFARASAWGEGSEPPSWVRFNLKTALL
jgi:K+-transporting ATPase ATPase A chain